MKRRYITLIALIIVITLLVACGNEKEDINSTPKPTENTGVNFEDLITPTHEVTTPAPTDISSPTPTEIPDFNDSNWSGLY